MVLQRKNQVFGKRNEHLPFKEPLGDFMFRGRN
jgi:hypothetical protein